MASPLLFLRILWSMWVRALSQSTAREREREEEEEEEEAEGGD
jgi:hypothetical protein